MAEDFESFLVILVRFLLRLTRRLFDAVGYGTAGMGDLGLGGAFEVKRFVNSTNGGNLFGLGGIGGGAILGSGLLFLASKDDIPDSRLRLGALKGVRISIGPFAVFSVTLILAPGLRNAIEGMNLAKLKLLRVASSAGTSTWTRYLES